ncbi:response regulator [Galbibacter mesophilus]|uniref:response regulator n=1 Tax=Galbibacter mesophilus TaxID=379069 RepID=UPI00191F799B|nr:response regulator [Galbibacter mesophilus]MCM5663333.1 response regulator [Galbibacter mesophilus]
MTKKTILLIEEDRMVSSLIGFRLKKEGFLVQAFSNEKQAVNTAAENSFDLVVYGLSSTSFEGIQFIEKVKATIGMSTPLILATSNKQQLITLNKSQLPNTTIIQKPIDLDNLLTMSTQMIAENQNSNQYLP